MCPPGTSTLIKMRYVVAASRMIKAVLSLCLFLTLLANVFLTDLSGVTERIIPREIPENLHNEVSPIRND